MTHTETDILDFADWYQECGAPLILELHDQARAHAIKLLEESERTYPKSGTWEVKLRHKELRGMYREYIPQKKPIHAHDAYEIMQPLSTGNAEEMTRIYWRLLLK